MDEIQEELEHIAFINECRVLVEEINWRVMSVTNERALRVTWDDIRVFGDEPAFTDCIFSKALEEALV